MIKAGMSMYSVNTKQPLGPVGQATRRKKQPMVRVFIVAEAAAMRRWKNNWSSTANCDQRDGVKGSPVPASMTTQHWPFNLSNCFASVFHSLRQ